MPAYRASPESETDLPLPYIAGRAHGGHYDDESLAAGWQAGATDTILRLAALGGITPKPRRVSPPLVAQIDLIAMRHGYHVTVEDAGIDEFGAWALIGFRRDPTGSGP